MKHEAKLLVIFATLSSLGVSMILPYIPLFGREVGMPISIVGFLIFAYYGIEVIARIPIGFLSDAIGHTLVIFAGAVSFVAASFFYLTSSSIWFFLLVAQLLLGIGISITWVTIPSFITIIRSSLPVYTFSVGLGWLIGPITGGIIKEQLGMYFLFFIFFLISLPLLALTLLFHREMKGSLLPSLFDQDLSKTQEKNSSLPPPSIPEIFTSTTNSFSDAFSLLKKSRRILLAALVSFIMFMNFAMGSSLVPLRFSDVGLSSFLIGTLLTIRTGTSTLIRLATERILKIGRQTLILIGGAALTGIVVFFFSRTGSLPVLVLLSIIWGLGGGIYLPIVFSLIADATDEAERGVAMGLRGTMGTTGSAIGVLVFMNLADVFDVSSSLALFGIFASAFSLILLLYWEATS